MHVIFVPGSVLKTNPAMWLQVVTKQRGAVGDDYNVTITLGVGWVMDRLVPFRCLGVLVKASPCSNTGSIRDDPY